MSWKFHTHHQYPNLSGLFGAVMDNLFRGRSDTQQAQLALAEQKYTELQDLLADSQAKAKRRAELEAEVAELQAKLTTLKQLRQETDALKAYNADLKQKLQERAEVEKLVIPATTTRHPTSIDQEVMKIRKAQQLDLSQGSTAVDSEAFVLNELSKIKRADGDNQTSIDAESRQMRNVTLIK